MATRYHAELPLLFIPRLDTIVHFLRATAKHQGSGGSVLHMHGPVGHPWYPGRAGHTVALASVQSLTVLQFHPAERLARG